MRTVPVRAAARYHRWAREDVEQLDSAQTSLLIEMGRLHRDGVVPIHSAIDPLDEPAASRLPGKTSSFT
jgi:hypothetical protein